MARSGSSDSNISSGEGCERTNPMGKPLSLKVGSGIEAGRLDFKPGMTKTLAVIPNCAPISSKRACASRRPSSSSARNCHLGELPDGHHPVALSRSNRGSPATIATTQPLEPLRAYRHRLVVSPGQTCTHLSIRDRRRIADTPRLSPRSLRVRLWPPLTPRRGSRAETKQPRPPPPHHATPTANPTT